MPSHKWSDLLHEAHNRAFVVAGATKDALVADFHRAIDDAITKGIPFKGWTDKTGNYREGFLDTFDKIVERHGWDYNGGRDWRARVIYDTNLKSAYAAGRYKQMNDPATVKAFPYWQYVHGMHRIPLMGLVGFRGHCEVAAKACPVYDPIGVKKCLNATSTTKKTVLTNVAKWLSARDV